MCSVPGKEMVNLRLCDAKAKWACGNIGVKDEHLVQTGQKEHIHNTHGMCTYGYEVGGAQHEWHKTGMRDGRGI